MKAHSHSAIEKIGGWFKSKTATLLWHAHNKVLMRRQTAIAAAASSQSTHKNQAWDWAKALGLSGLLMLPAASAFAGLPWEGPLCTVATSLSGPVANSVGVIVVVLTGLMLAFGEVSGVFKTLLAVLFGLSVAFLANSWLGLFDGRSSGCYATS